MVPANELALELNELASPFDEDDGLFSGEPSHYSVVESQAQNLCQNQPVLTMQAYHTAKAIIAQKQIDPSSLHYAIYSELVTQINKFGLMAAKQMSTQSVASARDWRQSRTALERDIHAYIKSDSSTQQLSRLNELVATNKIPLSIRQQIASLNFGNIHPAAILMEHAMPVDFTDGLGNTLLHVSYYVQLPEIAENLARFYGANGALKNIEGMIPSKMLDALDEYINSESQSSTFSAVKAISCSHMHGSAPQIIADTKIALSKLKAKLEQEYKPRLVTHEERLKYPLIGKLIHNESCVIARRDLYNTLVEILEHDSILSVRLPLQIKELKEQKRSLMLPSHGRSQMAAILEKFIQQMPRYLTFEPANEIIFSHYRPVPKKAVSPQQISELEAQVEQLKQENRKLIHEQSSRAAQNSETAALKAELAAMRAETNQKSAEYDAKLEQARAESDAKLEQARVESDAKLEQALEQARAESDAKQEQMQTTLRAQQEQIAMLLMRFSTLTGDAEPSKTKDEQLDSPHSPSFFKSS